MDNGIEENVALIVFGEHTQVLQHLTNDYDKIRETMSTTILIIISTFIVPRKLHVIKVKNIHMPNSNKY